MQEGKRLISIQEAAKRLGISKHTLYGWVSKRRIAFVKVGRRTLFQPLELDRFVEKHSVSAQAA